MPKRIELTLDELLAVLGNPLRRDILERITKETHYPLQLSKELKVSQQAIMKQLTVLEKHHLVRCREKQSTSHGPPRKCYVSMGQFSIRIDYGPNTFETNLMPHDRLMDDEDESEDDGPEAETEELSPEIADEQSALEEVGRLKTFSDRINGVMAEMAGLEDRRAELSARRQELLREAIPTITRLGQTYEERRFLFLLLEHPEKSLADIVAEAEIPQRSLERLHRLLSAEYGNGRA